MRKKSKYRKQSLMDTGQNIQGNPRLVVRMAGVVGLYALLVPRASPCLSCPVNASISRSRIQKFGPDKLALGVSAGLIILIIAIVVG